MNQVEFVNESGKSLLMHQVEFVNESGRVC